MASDQRTSARVTITLDIPVGSHWSPEVKADQVYRQARDHAIEMIERGISVDGVQVRMISCRVMAIMSEIEK